MQSLDPRWLSIELESIQRDENDWDAVFKESYDLAVQRVLAFQAKFEANMQGEVASDKEIQIVR
jgi:hypothetical protein